MKGVSTAVDSKSTSLTFYAVPLAESARWLHPDFGSCAINFFTMVTFTRSDRIIVKWSASPAVAAIIAIIIKSSSRRAVHWP